jgi:ketosteroid isomerase-like protein
MEQTILSLEKGAMERWRNGDPWGWAEISAEDVTYVDPGLTRPIVGLDEYKAYLRQFEGNIRYQGSEFIDPKVVIVGDAAVLTYNYLSTTTTPEGSVTNQTLWNTTEVYFRLGGKGDPWGFTEISTPDVTYFDTETPQRLNGLDVLKTESAKREGKIHYDVMEFIDPRIQIHGELVVLTYRFFSTRLAPDGSISSRTPWNCSEVFVRAEGQWRIIHTHWSYIKGERM